MIWNETIECASREYLSELQSKRLRDCVSRVYHNVPYYRTRMQEAGILPGDIKTIEDIVKLPFTNKQDLRDNYPFGTFAVPTSEIVRIHASTGTTGKPTVVGRTRKDLSIWAECVARALTLSGVTKEDIVQVAYGYGLFTGGLGIHYGVENLGAAVVPASTGNTKKQIQLLQDFGTTAIACTPSYALYLADTIKDMGLDPKKDLKLRVGIFGAEPWTEEMRNEIENKLNIKAHDIYGLSEIMGPGVACDCDYQNGLHVCEDYFFPEILNPETGEPCKDGEVGELVFSSFIEGMPLLRYRTHDLSKIIPGQCQCGRTTRRIAKLMGRCDDMLIIRGVNVFPSQVESVLLSMPEATPHYMLTVDRKGLFDSLTIQVEIKEELYSDNVKDLENFQKKIKSNIESVLGISVIVQLKAPKSLPRFEEGKAKRVIDNRK
ncbi:MAG: phenylacetate--CoA ligase [Bacteroidales bacterium]|nr:phenylacetate--CoA ligase [Bacteroidales bacterium]